MPCHCATRPRFVRARGHAQRAPEAARSARDAWHCPGKAGTALPAQGEGGHTSQAGSVLTSPDCLAVQLQELRLHSDFTVRLAIACDCAPAQAGSKNKHKSPFFFFF